MWTPTHVQVTVNRARNLIPKGKGGTNDCYVSIGLGKEKYQTSVKEKSNDPEWHEECDLPLQEMGKTAAKVRLKVYHKNVLGTDDFLGYMELPLSDFSINETPRSKWYELTDRPDKKKASGKYRGELEVKLAFIVQSKSSSTLSLNTKSSILRTGSFRSITNLGEKLKLPKRGGSFKEKTKSGDDKEKKSKTLSVFESFGKKKSGSKLSLGKSKEDLNTSKESQFYDEVKNSDPQDAGFSRSGSYRQPIGRGSKRVKRAASDADAKKPESKVQAEESNQLSDSREMASSMGRLDDKDSAFSRNTFSSSEESQMRSAHSIPEVIPEVESPTMEDLKSFAEKERQREDRERERKYNRMERKYSADGRQSSGDFPPEQRFVLGEESKDSQKKKKPVSLPPEVLEQYSDVSREELIQMVHQHKRDMERKHSQIKDLENYIDNLLVRVMETTPKLLQKPPEVTHPGFHSMTNGHHRDSQKSQARNTRY